jgi:hypothetical protein
MNPCEESSVNKPAVVAVICLLSSPCAKALDRACEPYIAAAEKTTEQPERHSVAETDDGTRMEAILIGERFYTSIGGKWQLMKIDLRASERQLNDGVRSGRIPLSNCRDLGNETIDGTPTRVIGYRITYAGAEPADCKAYIGRDGLVYAQSAAGQRVRYRYRGVKAPL